MIHLNGKRARAKKMFPWSAAKPTDPGQPSQSRRHNQQILKTKLFSKPETHPLASIWLHPRLSFSFLYFILSLLDCTLCLLIPFLSSINNTKSLKIHYFKISNRCYKVPKFPPHKELTCKSSMLNIFAFILNIPATENSISLSVEETTTTVDSKHLPHSFCKAGI